MNKATTTTFVISLLFHLGLLAMPFSNQVTPNVKKVKISLMVNEINTEKIGIKESVEKKEIQKINQIKKVVVKKKVIKKKVARPKQIPRIRKIAKKQSNPVMPTAVARAFQRSEKSLPPQEKIKSNEKVSNSICLASRGRKNEKPVLATEKSSLFQKYLGLIREKIEKEKVYPERARRNCKEGLVKVEFTILAEGKLKKVKVVKSSGKRILDQATLKAIRQAAPFPPIPKALRMEEMKINLAVVFELKT